MEKIAKLAKVLKTEELKSFALTCPINILDTVLAELETRLSETEFIEFSNNF